MSGDAGLPAGLVALARTSSEGQIGGKVPMSH